MCVCVCVCVCVGGGGRVYIFLTTHIKYHSLPFLSMFSGNVHPQCAHSQSLAVGTTCLQSLQTNSLEAPAMDSYPLQVLKQTLKHRVKANYARVHTVVYIET